jgi:hypothetical protein
LVERFTGYQSPSAGPTTSTISSAAVMPMAAAMKFFTTFFLSVTC